MKRSKIKRFLCAVIAIAMIASCLPLSVFAAEADYMTTILQQPTADDLRVIASPVNKVESYQWYRRVYGDGKKLTQSNVSESSTTWWDATNESWRIPNSLYQTFVFSIDMDAGEKIRITSAVSIVKIYLESADTTINAQKISETDEAIVYEVTAAQDSTWSLYMLDFENGGGPVSIEYIPLLGEQCAGQTTNTLTEYTYSDIYWCEVTFKNGNKLITEKIDTTARIIAQPTADDPTVEVSFEKDASAYQWYSLKLSELKEITDETAESYETAYYNSAAGWLGEAYDLGVLLFDIELSAGESVYLKANEMTDAHLLSSSVGNIAFDATRDGDYFVLTPDYSGKFTVYVETNDTTVLIKAYISEYLKDVTLSGETSKTLSDPEYGKSYICEISYKDNVTKLTSDIITMTAKVTKEPTVEEPTVEVSFADKTTYQWYEISNKEITDEYDGFSSITTYDPTVGWIGNYEYPPGRIYTFGLESIGSLIQLGKEHPSNVITVITSKPIERLESNNGVEIEGSGKAWKVTVPDDYSGTVPFNMYTSDEEITMRAYWGDVTETPITDQTAKTLTKYEHGKSYRVKATYTDGTVLTSDIIKMTPKITKEPTADKPTVEVNLTDNVVYQWYEVSNKEITDEDEKIFQAFGQYDPAVGWTGNAESFAGKISFMNIIVSEGDTIVFTTSRPLEASELPDSNYAPVEGSDSVYRLTAVSTGHINLQLATDDTDVTVRAYWENATETSIADQTTNTLTKYEANKKYVCKATYTDGTVLISDIITMAPKITKEPTADKPTVEVSFADKASYQWYEAAFGEEITDDTTGISTDLYGGTSSYDPSVGWSGVFYEEGEYDYFLLDMSAGDEIFVFTSDPVENLYTYDNTGYITVTGSGNTWTVTASADVPSTVEIYMSLGTKNANVKLRAYWGPKTLGSAVEGQTSKTLTKYEIGKKYLCKATYTNGTVLTSDVIDMTPEITTQPTAERPTVEVSFADKARYQWYEAALGEEITDDTTGISTDLYEGTSSYDPSVGWSGVLCEGEYDYFQLDMSAGDEIFVFTSEPVEYLKIYEDATAEVTGSGDMWRVVVSGEGTIYVSLGTEDPDVTLRAYWGPMTLDSAVEGQTSKTLTKYEVGKKYICKVTYTGGATLTSNVVTMTPEIITQPTAEVPTVDVALDDSVTYQWYEMSFPVANEITSNNIDDNIGEDGGVYGQYIPGVGWTGAYSGSYIQFFRNLIVPAGSTVTVVTSAPISDLFVGESGNAKVEGSGSVWTVTSQVEYDCYVATIITTDDPGITIRAYSGSATQTAIDGQTTDTLTKYEAGKYYFCKVSCADGAVLTSDLFITKVIIISQPTDADRKVDVNVPSGVVGYQWYTVDKEASNVEITDETATADTESYTYSSEKGWLGVSNGSSYKFLSASLNRGQTLNVTLSEPFDQLLLSISGTESALGGTKIDDLTWRFPITENNTYTLVGIKDDYSEAMSLSSDSSDETVTAKAYVYTPVVVGEPVDGQDTAELTSVTAGETYLCVVATYNSGALVSDSFTATVKEETPENAAYDADSNKITGLRAGAKYIITVDGTPTEVTADENGCVAVSDAWLGKSITVATAARDEFYVTGDEKTIQLPAPTLAPDPDPTPTPTPGGDGGASGGGDSTGGNSGDDSSAGGNDSGTGTGGSGTDGTPSGGDDGNGGGASSGGSDDDAGTDGSDSTDSNNGGTTSGGDSTEATGNGDSTDPTVEDGDEGLPAAAVVAIVIGSAAALGGGGFALWWFVFRKKKLI